MPAVSEAQRKFIFATKGAEFAKEHHFDNKGPLPEHVGDEAPPKVGIKKKAPPPKIGVKKAQY